MFIIDGFLLGLGFFFAKFVFPFLLMLTIIMAILFVVLAVAGIRKIIKHLVG